MSYKNTTNFMYTNLVEHTTGNPRFKSLWTIYTFSFGYLLYNFHFILSLIINDRHSKWHTEMLSMYIFTNTAGINETHLIDTFQETSSECQVFLSSNLWAHYPWAFTGHTSHLRPNVVTSVIRQRDSRVYSAFRPISIHWYYYTPIQHPHSTT